MQLGIFHTYTAREVHIQLGICHTYTARVVHIQLGRYIYS